MKKTLNVLFSFLAVTLVSSALFADTYAATASADSNGIYALGAAIAIAIAAAFGALSQSKAASVALEGIARNPGAASKVQTPMIIGLALIESLVIYGFVIAILLLGKIPNVPA
ncbi:MAG: ATP synthase F0 subunit C [Deltaproteobacteria bacterium]|nr:ATP synthase F0 subunit C [Deltaproteobacteria bacterium]